MPVSISDARKKRRTERQSRVKSLLDASGMRIQTAALDGVHLRFAFREGVGSPMLLCNGIGANLEILLPLIVKLSERPVVIVDMPGTGGSASALFWPSPRSYARKLAAVLDYLEWTEPVVVAGVSWGGALAQQFARSYPQRVSRLILIATCPGIIMFPGRVSALRHMITPWRYLSRRYLARHAGSLFGGRMRQGGQVVRHYGLLMKPPHTSGYMQQLLALCQFSSLPWLHRLACPTLVLNGDDDPLAHPWNARLMAALIPDAHLKILPGAGHLFLTLQAKRTAGLIEDFLVKA